MQLFPLDITGNRLKHPSALTILKVFNKILQDANTPIHIAMYHAYHLAYQFTQGTLY